MTSAQFKLDTFEGPLDLLLNLISQHKLNIYDIEITVLLDQYLDYINNLDHNDYEYAAEFLEMAARLIYIKTCYLLPREEEAVQLKKELEGSLIEYSLCKKAAQKLRESYMGGDIFVRNPVKLPVNKTYTREHDPMTLYEAYMGLSEQARNSKPLKATMFEPIVARKIVSVTSKITYILTKLYGYGEFEMSHLYDGMTDKSEKVATFLAVLELTRSGRIYLNDDNTMIYFNRNSQGTAFESSFDSEDKGDDEDKNEIDDSLIEALAENEDEQTSEEESTEEESTEIDVEIYPDEQPDDEIRELRDSDEAVHEVYAEHRERSVSVYRHSVKSLAERLEAPKLSAELKIDIPLQIDSPTERSAVEVESESADGQPESSVTAEILTDDVTESDSQPETEQLSDEVLEEIRLLAGLSAEPPETVFKPNYWQCSRYFWGNSPVGDDKSGNYWRFGNLRN